MRYTRASVVGLAAVFAAVGLAGCGGGPGYKKTGVDAAVPSLTGSVLSDARTTAGGAGFKNLKVADATGAKRSTKSATAWRVCFQSPVPGTSQDTGAPVRLSAARVGEACPSTDRGGASPTSTHTRRPTHRPTHRVTHHSSGASDDYSGSSGSSGGSGSSHHSSSHSHSHHH